MTGPAPVRHLKAALPEARCFSGMEAGMRIDGKARGQGGQVTCLLLQGVRSRRSFFQPGCILLCHAIQLSHRLVDLA